MHVSQRAIRVQLVNAFLVFNEEVATVENRQRYEDVGRVGVVDIRVEANRHVPGQKQGSVRAWASHGVDDSVKQSRCHRIAFGRGA